MLANFSRITVTCGGRSTSISPFTKTLEKALKGDKGAQRSICSFQLAGKLGFTPNWSDLRISNREDFSAPTNSQKNRR